MENDREFDPGRKEEKKECGRHMKVERKGGRNHVRDFQ